MNKLIIKSLTAALVLSMLTSCTLKAETEPVVSPEEAAHKAELMQNDYRGSITRTKALQDGILGVMENMKQNNVILREENPNSFWSKEDYQDFVVNFLNTDIINDTQWFTEEENNWETVVQNVSSNKNSFTSKNSKGEISLNDGVKIRRNEKDDYSVYSSGKFVYNNITYEAPYSYNILYDCDKDWAKAYAETNFNASVPSATLQLFEYARIDENTFAIQTNKERLVVVLEDVAEDTLISDRKIKEFYYSKLTNGGERTTFTPYKKKSAITADGAYDEGNIEMNTIMDSYKFLNENGDVSTLYGKNNSIFLAENIVESTNSNWVFEDKSLQQAIIYKDGALVVVTYNKLTENYERFIYTLDGVDTSVADKLAEMIEIKDLVGVNKSGEDAELPDEINPNTEAVAHDDTPKKDTSKSAGGSHVGGDNSSSESEDSSSEEDTESKTDKNADSETTDDNSSNEESSDTNEGSSEEDSSNEEDTESGSLTDEEIEAKLKELEELKAQKDSEE